MFLIAVIVLLVLIRNEKDEDRKKLFSNIFRIVLIAWASLVLISALIISTVGFMV